MPCAYGAGLLMLQGKLNQIATYWPPGKRDPYGFIEWGAPQLLKVRWQAHQKLIRNKAGVEAVSDAVVYTTEDINLSGRLYLGESTGYPWSHYADDTWNVLSDRTWEVLNTGATDPTTLPGSREPQAKSSMVGLDGEIVGWKVWL